MKDDNDFYFPADASLNIFTPAQKEVKYMLHLVAYDIANPKRLRRVANICKDYGVRVEFSVFECDLPPELFKQMWLELTDVINDTEDALLVYILCKSCIERTLVAGTAIRTEKPQVFII